MKFSNKENDNKKKQEYPEQNENMTDNRDGLTDAAIRLAMMDCGDRDVAMFKAIDDSEIVLSRRLNKKIERLLKRQVMRQEPRVAGTPRKRNRFALVAAILAAVLVVVLLGVAAFRNCIWKAMIHWHDNYFTVRYEPTLTDTAGEGAGHARNNVSEGDSALDNTPPTVDDESSEQPSVPTLPGGYETPEIPITLPNKIEVARKPTNLPDGVIEDVFESQSFIYRDYYLNDILVFSFNQSLLKPNDQYIDNQTAKIKEINFNGYQASLITHIDPNNLEISIIWNDGEYTYLLITDSLSEEQLISIAKSVM